jgi:hypothetical protein
MQLILKVTLLGLVSLLLVDVSFAAQNRPNPIDANKNQDLSLSSSDLGLMGPLNIGLQWSDQFGVTVNTKYTTNIGNYSAIALGLELGMQQRRINSTWGYALSKHQRIKITYENLSQNLNFDFRLWNCDRDVVQDAAGATYQVLFPHHVLNTFSINAFYAKARSQDLGMLRTYENNIWWDNYRRIAGGIDKSISAGLDLLPNSTNLVNLQLNYDDLYYDTKYKSNRAQNSIGETLDYKHLLNNRLRLDIYASHRQIYDDYKADIDWLLNDVSGMKFELGIYGERINNIEGRDNDKVFGINFSIAQSFNSKAQYVLGAQDSLADIKGWVSDPAVHMAQVLAITDEKRERSAGNGNSNNQQTLVSSKNIHPIFARPGEKITVNFKKYLSSANAKNIHFEMENLPEQLSVLDKNADKVTGVFTKDDVGKTFKFTVKAISASNDMHSSLYEFGFTVKVIEPNTVPIPNAGFIQAPTNLTLNAPVKSIENSTKFYLSKNNGIAEHKNALFLDPNWKVNNIEVDGVGIDNALIGSGLSYKLTMDIYHPEKNAILTIIGTPINPGVYTIPVRMHHARTSEPWSDSQYIKLKVVDRSPIIKPLPDQSFAYKQHIHIDISQYINPGEGAELKAVESVNLAQYGLKIVHEDNKVFIDGDVNKFAMTQQSAAILVTNNYALQQKAIFNFYTPAPPIKSSDMGSRTVADGNALEPIDLENHFNLTEGSDPISDWDIEVRSADGSVDVKGKEAVKKDFGLEIDYNELRGVIKNMASHSSYIVSIVARNSAGFSRDDKGVLAAAKLHLIVSQIDHTNIIGTYK